MKADISLIPTLLKSCTFPHLRKGLMWNSFCVFPGMSVLQPQLLCGSLQWSPILLSPAPPRKLTWSTSLWKALRPLTTKRTRTLRWRSVASTIRKRRRCTQRGECTCLCWCLELQSSSCEELNSNHLLASPQSVDLPAQRARAKRPTPGPIVFDVYTRWLCSPLPSIHPGHHPHRHAEWVNWTTWLSSPPVLPRSIVTHLFDFLPFFCF